MIGTISIPIEISDNVLIVKFNLVDKNVPIKYKRRIFR